MENEKILKYKICKFENTKIIILFQSWKVRMVSFNSKTHRWLLYRKILFSSIQQTCLWNINNLI